MKAITYKANCDEVLARLRSLYDRQAQDRVLAIFSFPGTNRALAAFREKYPAGPCSYLDPLERIMFWDNMLQERMGIEDDSIPSVYLNEFDQGLYGGLLGGEVMFTSDPDSGRISSMVRPLLDGWTGFDALRFDESHPWFHRYLHQLQIFVVGSGDKFGISHLILIDGLNFVFELMGATAAYLSLFDHPEMVRRAIDLAFDLNVKVQNTFFGIVPLLMGGTSSLFVQWIPGKIVAESVDPFHMTSVDTFEEWGREPIDRIFGQYDGGVLHIHGNGRHLLEAVCSLKGLKALCMLDNKGFPSAFEIRNDLRSRTGDTPLTIAASFAAFTTELNQHKLPGGVLYQVYGAPGIDAINRCMEKVRAYRV